MASWFLLSISWNCPVARRIEHTAVDSFASGYQHRRWESLGKERSGRPQLAKSSWKSIEYSCGAESLSLSSSASPFSPIESPDVATWYPVETRYPASLCRWRRALWWKCRLLHAFEHYADYNEPNLPKRCKILLIIRIVCNFLKSFLISLSYRCSKAQVKVSEEFCIDFSLVDISITI